MEEILRKWDAIDDEIWAKVIVLERNRRVAKVNILGRTGLGRSEVNCINEYTFVLFQAYARAPVLTINGGNGGFDGYRC